MLQSELTGDLKKRLSTAKGQIESIIKMRDNETDPDKILAQFKAAAYLLMDEAFRKSHTFYYA
jgi:DNA-binding FrmR family transcriptional regulator